MVKLSANISKKLPIPGLEYSSQSFGASMEIEVSDADKPDAIQARIQELYGLLSNSIDAQITGAPNVPTHNGHVLTQATTARLTQAPQSQPVHQRSYANGRNRLPAAGSNGNGRSVTATEAQCRAIFAICKSQGIDMASVLADFNVADAKDLAIKDASRLIDDLKSRQAQNGNGH